MAQNIIEYLRKECVTSLFSGVFYSVWPRWKTKIVADCLSPSITPTAILNIGDHLHDIFTSTSAGRDQSSVAGGGSSWEALVCWYLNLCNIGRKTVVIKHNNSFIPKPISDGITVNYGSFVSNTESDLIAITFPDKTEYEIDKNQINITDENGLPVEKLKNNGDYNMLGVLSSLCARDFNNIQINIIQCKTNWNDNAQIPMLWDMVYSATGFRRVTVGRNNYSIANCLFKYSFVTVPTTDPNRIVTTSTCVKRVENLSGGNYWGLPTRSGVASSIKEINSRNFGGPLSHINTLHNELPKLRYDYNYFDL